MSVGLHLVINDGNPEGLFHGAFMVRKPLWLGQESVNFSSHSNPVLPGLCKTSQLNNPCSINSSLTLGALGLPT